MLDRRGPGPGTAGEAGRTPDGPSRSRRALLRAGALGLAGALAGCARVSFRGGTTLAFDSVLPAPESVNRLLYRADVVRPGRVRADGAPMAARREAARLAVLDPAGIATDRVDFRVDLVQNTTVTVGSFGRSRIAGELTRRGYEAEGRTRGYTVLTDEGPDGTTVVAVRDGVSVATTPWHLATAPPPRERVASVIAAERGVRDRYGEAFPPVATVIQRLAGADLAEFVGFPREARDRLDLSTLDGLRARGGGVTVENGGLRRVQVLVFASPDAVDEAMVRRWVDRGQSEAVLPGGVEVVTQGATVEVTWHSPTEEHD